MPNCEYFRRSLEGAYLLARFDPDGMNRFDLTSSGFVKSFWAAALVLPFYIIFVVGSFDGTEVSTGTFALVRGLAYVAGWIAFPIAMIFLASLLKLSSNYVPFIVASNWAAVLQTVIFVPANIVATRTSMEGDFAPFLFLVTLTVVLIYQWNVARTSLATTGLIASGLVAVDVLLGVMIDLGFARLI
jgi:hypothetical protein